MYKMTVNIQGNTVLFHSYRENFIACSPTNGLRELQRRNALHNPVGRMLWFLVTTSPASRPHWISLEIIDKYLSYLFHNCSNSAMLQYHVYLAWCVQLGDLPPLDLKKFLS